MPTITVKDAANASQTVNTLPPVGAAASSASLPVVIASDQTVPVSLASIPAHAVTNAGTFPVQATQAGTWTIGNITGSVTLPTGAASETTLASLNGKIPSPGQGAMASSVPVVIASNQTAIPVTGSFSTTVSATYNSSAPTVTNGATSALQCDVNGNLKVNLASGTITVSASAYATLAAAFTARPANTTQYTPGDTWQQNTSPAALTFSSVALTTGGGATITDLLVFSSNNQTATLPLTGELWLFDGSVSLPTTADNASFTLTAAQHATLVGRIPFSVDATGDATVGTGNASGHYRTSISVNCAAGSTSLKALVKVTNNYTPASAEVLSFKMVVQR